MFPLHSQSLFLSAAFRRAACRDMRGAGHSLTDQSHCGFLWCSVSEFSDSHELREKSCASKRLVALAKVVWLLKLVRHKAC